MKEQILNALKIAFASIGAISFAQLIGLDFSISAGIVAILTVGPTKKDTFKTAINRFYAFIIALILSFIWFSTLGYELLGFFMYLITFLLVCQFKGWGNAMAMNSVLISHFLTYKIMDFTSISNEILLFCIGVGFGIGANLHLHENVDFMKKMEKETDEQIKMILSRMATRIVDRNMEDYNGECFTEIRESLRRANQIAQTNFMNQFRKKVSLDMQYIAMREQQTIVLYNIYKRARRLKTTPKTADAISRFLQFLSLGYGKETPVEEALERFYILQQGLAGTPLPVTREEFETRAELYAILGCMEELLLIKRDYFIEMQKS